MALVRAGLAFSRRWATTAVSESEMTMERFLKRIGQQGNAKHFESFDHLKQLNSKAMKEMGISVVDRKRILRGLHHLRVGFRPL
mmetsp:Transcript_47973/g.117553  ORF Transcript_47973/g.117553 Transcript_47973/m.117553 type:complete len:84 (-) Transcript_47973:43-294(-)